MLSLLVYDLIDDIAIIASYNRDGPVTGERNK